MTALPPVAEAAIAAVLVVSMGRAFFGSAPQRADVVAAVTWLIAAVILLGTVLLTEGDALWRLAMTVAGVEAACVAGWWLRSRDDGDEGSDAGSAPDWDAFDRLRRDWDRDRPTAGV